MDDVSGILTQGVARRRQLQAAVGADEQRHTQAVLQQVDLLDDAGGEIYSCSAARLKLPASATQRNVSSWGL